MQGGASNMTRNNKNESGLVSILTVIMFTIFISIMVVGFIKIMTDEQRQTTDNDLSASALAAAQSGVEDAKRIILYCRDNNSGPCTNLLNSANQPDECSIFTSGGSQGILTSAAQLNYDATKTSVLVGEAEFQQSYTCLTIDSKPTKVEKSLIAGRSTIIPLNMDSLADIDITWYVDTGTYGTRTVAPGNLNFTPSANWTQTSSPNIRPSVLRAQIIPYTPGAVNLNDSERDSDAFFFVSTLNATSTSISRNTDARNTPGLPRTSTTVPIVYTLCDTPAGRGYSCTMKVTDFAASPSEHYYLRLSLIYGSTAKIKVTGRDTGTTPVTFDGTQYVVDVTGRANDVFRRVRSYVSPASFASLPEYAVESNGPICKNILVAVPASTQYICP